jgi:hypothetical protein
MNEKQQLVGVAKFLGITGAYILVSASKHVYEAVPELLGVDAHMSFLYHDGTVAAEWEPQYGPIQLWYSCDGAHPEAMEHYFFDYVLDRPTSWSQLAVDEEGLKEAFLRGDYIHIYSVLHRWASEIGSRED